MRINKAACLYKIFKYYRIINVFFINFLFMGVEFQGEKDRKNIVQEKIELYRRDIRFLENQMSLYNTRIPVEFELKTKIIKSRIRQLDGEFND